MGSTSRARTTPPSEASATSRRKYTKVANSWEQLDHEGPKAFDAFSKYLDLDPAQRSIDAAWRSSLQSGRRQRSTGRAPRQWFTWSSTHHWPERAAARDAHEQTIRQESREQRIKDLEERRADFEISQLPRLVKAEQSIWKTLDDWGKRGVSARLDPGYRGLHKTALLLGREIANGPRKKPADAVVQAGAGVLIEVRFVAAKPTE